MNKKILSTLLMVALLSAGTSFSTNTYADVQAESEASVQFIINETETSPPVNPENPDEELEVDGENNGTAGSLRIDHASNIDFGTQYISGRTVTYNALANDYFVSGTSNTIQIPAFVQVTDNRGTNNGWALSVSSSEIKSETSELNNAQIRINRSELSSSESVGEKYFPNVNISTDGTNSHGLIGDSVELMRAGQDQGMGQWQLSFGLPDDIVSGENTAITLQVPGTTAINQNEKYSAILSWTLTDSL